MKFHSHPQFAVYEDESGCFHNIRILNPDRNVLYGDHSDDVLCPYDVNCKYNREPFRCIAELCVHLSKDHSHEYRKQLESKPALVIRFPDKDIQIYLQCGHCVNYFSLGYTRHYDHYFKKGPVHLKWECANMDLYNFRCRVKVPMVSVTGESFFDKTFGDGSFDYLRKRALASEHIDTQLKENLEWSAE